MSSILCLFGFLSGCAWHTAVSTAPLAGNCPCLAHARNAQTLLLGDSWPWTRPAPLPQLFLAFLPPLAADLAALLSLWGDG